MQTMTIALEPTAVDIERIFSYEELLETTNQKLHAIVDYNEQFQRVRFQCKVATENLKRTIDSYYLLLEESNDYSQSMPERLSKLVEEQRKELDELSALKELLFRKIEKAMNEYVLGTVTCQVEA